MISDAWVHTFGHLICYVNHESLLHNHFKIIKVLLKKVILSLYFSKNAMKDVLSCMKVALNGTYSTSRLFCS